MKNNLHSEAATKRTSGILTLGITACIVGVMFLFAFAPPDPPMAEAEGLLVDFGTDLTGLGLNEPNDVASAPPPKSTTVENKVITQTKTETIKVKDNKPTDKPKTQTSTSTNTKPVINEDELFNPGKINTSGQTGSNSEGNSTYGGNQGNPTGDPDGYHGPGAGVGDDGSVGWSLDGRSMKAKPTLKVDHNEIGDIRIKIYVDRNGKVTKADYERSGSTITDANLIAQAKSAAMKSTFNVDQKSPVTQIGYITFHFKLQ